MKKERILERLLRIHKLVYNEDIEYSKEPEFKLCEKDREIDRLLRRIEHICKSNKSTCHAQ